MNTFATGSLPVHFSVAKLFNFRWQYTDAKLLYIRRISALIPEYFFLNASSIFLTQKVDNVTVSNSLSARPYSYDWYISK